MGPDIAENDIFVNIRGNYENCNVLNNREKRYFLSWAMLRKCKILIFLVRNNILIIKNILSSQKNLLNLIMITISINFPNCKCTQFQNDLWTANCSFFCTTLDTALYYNCGTHFFAASCPKCELDKLLLDLDKMFEMDEDYEESSLLGSNTFASKIEVPYSKYTTTFCSDIVIQYN